MAQRAALVEEVKRVQAAMAQQEVRMRQALEQMQVRAGLGARWGRGCQGVASMESPRQGRAAAARAQVGLRRLMEQLQVRDGVDEPARAKRLGALSDFAPPVAAAAPPLAQRTGKWDLPEDLLDASALLQMAQVRGTARRTAARLADSVWSAPGILPACTSGTYAAPALLAAGCLGHGLWPLLAKIRGSCAPTNGVAQDPIPIREFCTRAATE